MAGHRHGQGLHARVPQDARLHERSPCRGYRTRAEGLLPRHRREGAGRLHRDLPEARLLDAARRDHARRLREDAGYLRVQRPAQARLSVRNGLLRTAGLSRYSGWIFAVRTTSPHFAVSLRMKSRKASGVPPATSPPLATMDSRCSGIARTALMSRLSRSTMARGVPAGTMTPCQLVDSNPGNPASARVGTSGRSAMRVVEVTASARTLPALTEGSAA